MRSFGERVALNMPIQGTAADIIKLAMIRVRDCLAAEGLDRNVNTRKSPRLRRRRGTLVSRS